MKSIIDGLTEIQRDILKSRIFNQPKRPFGFSLAALYGDMDITKYSEDEVQNAIEDLVRKNLFEKSNDGSYIFSREQFLTVKSYFKNVLFLHRIKNSSLVFIKFLWKYFIVTIIAAALTAYVTTLITLKVKESRNQKTKNSDMQTISKTKNKDLPDDQKQKTK